MWYLYVKQIPFDDISWSYVIKVYIKWQMEDPITLYIKIVNLFSQAFTFMISINKKPVMAVY